MSDRFLVRLDDCTKEEYAWVVVFAPTQSLALSSAIKIAADQGLVSEDELVNVSIEQLSAVTLASEWVPKRTVVWEPKT